MKRCYLLLGIVAALAVGAPAYSQYIFMDLNGDTVCDTNDLMTDATTSIDVYIDTNHNAAGGSVTCASSPSTPIDMFGYDIIVSGSSAGTVSYGSWTNAMTFGGTWTVIDAFRQSGNDASVGFIAPGAATAPGKYKIGSFAVTVSGSPVMSFLTTNASLGGGAPITGFGGSCSGANFAFTLVLGDDFTDQCGTSAGTPVNPTTWGAIKNLYR